MSDQVTESNKVPQNLTHFLPDLEELWELEPLPCGVTNVFVLVLVTALVPLAAAAPFATAPECPSFEAEKDPENAPRGDAFVTVLVIVTHLDPFQYPPKQFAVAPAEA